MFFACSIFHKILVKIFDKYLKINLKTLHFTFLTYQAYGKKKLSNNLKYCKQLKIYKVFLLSMLLLFFGLSLSTTKIW